MLRNLRSPESASQSDDNFSAQGKRTVNHRRPSLIIEEEIVPRIDPEQARIRTGSNYPPPFAGACAGRVKRAIGDLAGLTQFGVNLTRLEPGASSALLHWHAQEDEFVLVLDGAVVLVEGDRETPLAAGEAAGFKAGEPVGHCLQNRSEAPALILEVGTRSRSEFVTYPGLDLVMDGRNGTRAYVKRDGSAW
jgi:uncharacterized cupin superfamily protein